VTRRPESDTKNSETIQTSPSWSLCTYDAVGGGLGLARSHHSGGRGTYSEWGRRRRGMHVCRRDSPDEGGDGHRFLFFRQPPLRGWMGVGLRSSHAVHCRRRRWQLLLCVERGQKAAPIACFRFFLFTETRGIDDILSIPLDLTEATNEGSWKSLYIITINIAANTVLS
jgi:hypothetical protein